MNPILRIITDDFTSMADGLAPFAARGFSTVALTRPETLTEAQVVSVDTDSRHLGTDAACERVRHWSRQFSQAILLVKQFDSTLRGHFVDESLAAMEAGGRNCLLVAPAFPSEGRTTVDGVVYVNGVIVNKTAFGQDPRSPVASGDVRALFGRAGMMLRLAKDPVEAENLVTQGISVIFDASTEADLDALVKRYMQYSDRWDRVLWSGSTGLLRAMARTLQPVPWMLPVSVSPAMNPCIAVGSLHPAARAQLATLRSAIACDPAGKLRATVLASSAAPGDPDVEAVALANEVKAAVLNDGCDALLVVGGETSRATLEGLSTDGLQILREVEPGIALSVVNVGGRRLPMIAKAGGFGDSELLVRCLKLLLGGSV